jgi:hypothetical protein
MPLFFEIDWLQFEKKQYAFYSFCENALIECIDLELDIESV